LAATSSDTAFHEWRRRVKEHWYQTRLFQKGRRAIRGRARALKRLEGHLGEDHDLATLSRLLRRNPRRFGGEESTRAVLTCIDRRHAMRRRDALAAGRRLFADKPAKVASNIVDGWST